MYICIYIIWDITAEFTIRHANYLFQRHHIDINIWITLDLLRINVLFMTVPITNLNYKFQR